MKKEPNIDKKKIRILLEKSYPFEIRRFEFIPRGADADSYILTTKINERYFVKIYDLKRIKKLNLRVHFESLRVLNVLYQSGITYISYPVLNNNNELSINYKNYKIVVSNFIDGTNNERQLTKIQLENFAALLAKIHKSPPNIRRLIKHKENFAPNYLGRLETKLKLICERDWAQNPFQKKVYKILSANYSAILDFIKQTRALSKKIQLSEKDFVITHSDPYFLNLMKAKQDVYLIDWDGIKLGPKEQDIWFYLIKHICSKPFTFLSAYEKNFGPFKLNKRIIHYYMQTRVLEDFYQYIQEILSGKDEEINYREIKEYSLYWILNIEKMFEDVDKIVDKWNS